MVTLDLVVNENGRRCGVAPRRRHYDVDADAESRKSKVQGHMPKTLFLAKIVVDFKLPSPFLQLSSPPKMAKLNARCTINNLGDTLSGRSEGVNQHSP